MTLHALTPAEEINLRIARLQRPYEEKQFESAWQSVLFTHFHDILTGSCVQDSREHAMGQFSHAMAVAQARTALSQQRLAAAIDTSDFATEAAPGDQS